MDEWESKAIIRDTFNLVSNGYDNDALRFFRDSAEYMAACFDLRGDELVLDVATGTGGLALELAERLPRGRVTGVDFSEGMLGQATKKAAGRNARNVDFIEMDMQALEFGNDYFDAASCAFGIFFVEDMAGQLNHIADKVKPGGKIVVSSFYKNSFLPLLECLYSQIEAYGVHLTTPAWDKLSTEEKCATLYEKAGLQEVRIVRRAAGYYLSSPDDWWSVLFDAGYRRVLNRLSPAALNAFKREHLDKIEEFSTKDGIWLDVTVLYATGSKP